MGELMRARDWASTPLNEPAHWPQSLRTSVSTCLNCAFPILLWWGRELVMLYNDEYIPMLGAKHPSALGQAGAACWPEIWDVIGPMLGQVLERGEPTRSRDLLLTLERKGFPEECYFSFSYSPIRDETGDSRRCVHPGHRNYGEGDRGTTSQNAFAISPRIPPRCLT